MRISEGLEGLRREREPLPHKPRPLSGFLRKLWRALTAGKGAEQASGVKGFIHHSNRSVVMLGDSLVLASAPKGLLTEAQTFPEGLVMAWGGMLWHRGVFEGRRKRAGG